MKLQFMSDLHLEFRGSDYVVEPAADVLLLCGDIVNISHLKSSLNGPYSKNSFRPESHQRALNFFDDVSKKFKQVYVIPGNHETYDGHVVYELQDYKTFLEKWSNIVFLDDSIANLDEHTILVGSRLWTDCNKRDTLTMYHLNNMMSDYSLTRIGDYRKMRAEDTVIMHEYSVRYINHIAEVNPSKDIVVMSHHAPSMLSIHEYYQNDHLLNGGYASDLSDLILSNENIKCWVHGHTHFSFDYHVGQCRVMCNPKGYPSERNPMFYGVQTIDTNSSSV